MLGRAKRPKRQPGSGLPAQAPENPDSAWDRLERAYRAHYRPADGVAGIEAERRNLRMAARQFLGLGPGRRA